MTKPCCNQQELINGKIWDLSLLPVTICVNCEETIAQFGFIGNFILMLGDKLFNDTEGFMVKLDQLNPPVQEEQ